ncbi:hypothetical protein [Cohnella thailandensis]|uniref:Uncharacterized protein n=1 Tax=Cohnella thailandensis TaxID=557557 RepID=A0A841T1L0_9BACL|nr:hypothetical protein [Cohnella thailandensis]MBB6638293.1 hypothetical protein [Cohnella thailandensis]MBP1977228.1 hypothetical protein [Cohnella thailandensis]
MAEETNQEVVDDFSREQSSKETKEKRKGKAFPQSELPRVTLEDTIPIAQQIYENVANSSISFEELAKLLGTSVHTKSTKYGIWGSEAYGLLTKNEKGDYLLSETGRKIIVPTYDGEDLEAKIKAILTPTVLSKFYLEYNKHPIPQDNYFSNLLETKLGVPRDRIVEAKEIIIKNAEYTGILRKDSKLDKNIIDLDVATSLKVNNEKDDVKIQEIKEVEITSYSTNILESDEKTCFVICPIGEDSSLERKHSDLILKHLIQPVLDSFGYKVVRADKIEKSGLITQQIFDNLIKSQLCIADLSFNNPNVFYELGVRHMSQLPTVQIIRKGDKIPFDVSHGRTIVIDTSDVYTVFDRMESAKKELIEYVRAIVSNINNDISEDNPIRVYLPNIKVILPK